MSKGKPEELEETHLENKPWGAPTCWSQHTEDGLAGCTRNGKPSNQEVFWMHQQLPYKRSLRAHLRFPKYSPSEKLPNHPNQKLTLHLNPGMSIQLCIIFKAVGTYTLVPWSFIQHQPLRPPPQLHPYFPNHSTTFLHPRWRADSTPNSQDPGSGGPRGLPSPCSMSPAPQDPGKPERVVVKPKSPRKNQVPNESLKSILNIAWFGHCGHCLDYL